MAFGVGDSLTVNIDANTINFSRKVSSAEEDIQDLATAAIESSGGLQVLANRADNAGDQISQAGRRAGMTSGLFAGLSFSTSGLSLNLGGLATSASVATVGLTALTAGATALVSTLFPLAAVVGTLAGGLGALAGAFGAVVGSGILAFGAKRGEQNRKRLMETRQRIEQLEALQETEQGLTDTQEEELETLEERADKLEEQTGIMGGLKDAIAELGEELKPLIVDFGEAFIPLIEDALDAIPDLVENTLEAVGGLEVFVDALRDMGEAAMTAIPNLVAGMMDLARRALPVFIDGMEWLGRNGARIFDSMLRVTERLAPTLMGFLNTFINAVPALTKLGTVTLETLIPAFNTFLDTVKDIVNMGEGSSSITDFVKSLISNVTNWLTGPGKKKTANVGSSIISGIIGVIDPEGNEDTGFLDALTGRITSVLQGVQTWLDSGGSEKITNTITSLIDALGKQLKNLSDDKIQSTVTSLTGVIADITRSVANSLANDESKTVLTQLTRIASEIMDTLATEMINYTSSKQFQKDMVALGDAVATSFADAVAQQLKEKGALGVALAAFTGPFGGAAIDVGTDIGTAQNQRMSGFESGTQTTQNIRITVENGEIVAKMDERAEQTINNRERTVNRQSGRSPSPGL